MKFSSLLAVSTLILSLAGCKEDAPVAPQEVVQTVDWFKEHKAEREAQLAKCKANPGQLATTPNCMNADRAAQSSVWARRSGQEAPAPLTANEINQK